MLHTLAPELQQKLSLELKAGEQLQWVGQPELRAVRKAAMPLLLFFIPWTAFALFWTIAATGFQLPDLSRSIFYLLFPLFGLPFIGVGIWGLSMPWRMAKMAQFTVYAITTQRIIILTNGSKQLKCQSFYSHSLTNVSREQQPDGSGNLYFYNESAQHKNGKHKKQGFYGVADVQRVEALVLNLQAKAK